MGYINITQGLTISVPTSGTRNWAQNLLTNAWNKISAHDHTTGKGLQIATAALANLAVTSAKLARHLAGTQAATVTQSGDAATLDLDNGNIQQLSLVGATGAVTVTLSNPQTGGVYKIWITQAAVVRDITWPANVLWPQGVKYGVDVSQGASQIDLVTLYYDGTNYRGDWQLNWS